LKEVYDDNGECSASFDRPDYKALEQFIKAYRGEVQYLIVLDHDRFSRILSVWIIPGERMKMKLSHMVPLSRQALAHFKELRELNGHREYIFASYSKPRKAMSKNTVLVAIKRMGYLGRMTGHGFRSLGLGLLKEKLNYSHEIADRQLAHVPKNSVDRAYDRAQFLQQRKEMKQSYAGYIDRVYLEELDKKYQSDLLQAKNLSIFSLLK